MEKEIYSTKEMLEYGFKKRTLSQINQDPDCTHLFFRTGTGKTSNYYYYVHKVEKWLEMREDERRTKWQY